MRREIPDLIGRTLSHYRVLGRLGKGGMGEVYLAEDQRLSRRVALKVLLPDLALEPRHLERFRREARSVAALNHPNIVTIYSVEEAEGLHFLVLELVEGETLADLIVSGPLALDRLLAIALPLTDALEAAHARGVIHRDLKPRNVMVSREGRVKVLDFGIACLVQGESATTDDTTETGLTKTRGVIGTTAYMSPEQIQGLPVDHRSDLFSLGVVLYEMATGQRPFRGKGQLATMAAILGNTPPPPSSIVPRLPALLDEILSLCFSKDPALRYRAVADLRRELLNLLQEDETDLTSTSTDAFTSRLGESGSNSSTRALETNSQVPARPRCFGREKEVGELVDALCGSSRPIPVLGPAGAGKTTIALAALHEKRVHERFGRRRWFVRCEGTRSRTSLVGAIARAVCPEAIPPLEPSIFFQLREGPTLLVLDNFETPWEHDTTAVEELTTELEAIPGLNLIATLRGEQRPLGPDWREVIHAKPLDPHSARKTFLAIAGERFEHDPDFDSLLAALDGLPLAVVLLASQAEGEPDLSALRQRWREQRTDLLRRAGALERQQNLAVSLEISIASPRMTNKSLRLLAILGLLPEGVARNDLEALLPGYGNESASVLRKVGLVFDQGSRLRMLAPIREHVRQHHLPALEDLKRTIGHYLDLACLGEQVGSEGGPRAVERLRPETGNLEPLMTADLESADPVMAIRSVLAYSKFVRFTGLGEPILLERARHAAQQTGELELEADCIRRQADIYLYRSCYDQAAEAYDQARVLYRLLDNKPGEACCIARLGEVHLSQSQLEAATPYYEEALVHFRALGDQYWEAYCLLGIGKAVAHHSPASGRLLLEQARVLYSGLYDARGEANCLLHMGRGSFDVEDFHTAQQEFEAALSFFRQTGSLPGEANCLRNLGHIALRRCDPKTARSLCEQALALNRRVGSRLGEANCLGMLGEVAFFLSEADLAEALLQEARQLFQAIGQTVGEANCSAYLGEIAVTKSEFRKARSWFEEALVLNQSIPRPIWVGQAHLSLAKLALPGSRERLEHIEAARRAWEGVNLLDQMRDELEAAERAGAVSS